MDSYSLKHQNDAGTTTRSPHVATPDAASTLCEPCSTIPWNEIVSPSGHRSIARFIGEFHTQGPNFDSPCRICRFFAEVMRVHRITESQFYCEWRQHSIYPGFMGEFEFRSMFSKPGYNIQILITSLNTEDAKSNLHFLYPQQINFDVIKPWIQACKERHVESCSTTLLDKVQGLKVIDCESRIITSLPRDCEFLALSYVWGQSKSDFSPGKQILPNNLPATIEDSLTATLALGYSYIWIDRYCIDQQNEDEKHKLIHEMGNIYAAAQITLVAAVGNTPDRGLPGVRPRTREADVKHGSIGSVSLLMHPTSGIFDIGNSTWATRGWTFQEGYFSKRRLFFTERQTIWICNNEVHCEAVGHCPSSNELESLSGYLPHTVRSEDRDWRHMYQMGSCENESKKVLRSYSRRQLTYDSDALDAVVGALDRLSELYPNLFHVWAIPLILRSFQYPFYHFKTWTVEEFVETIQIALNWYHREPCRRRTDFPSWSLLGWTGPIEWGEESPLIVTTKIKFSDGSNQFQSLRDVTSFRHSEQAFSQIMITGQVCQVCLASISDEPWHSGPIYYTAISITSSFYLVISTRWDQNPSELINTNGIVCLALGRSEIDPISTTLDRDAAIIVMVPIDGAYHRVGLLAPYNWEEGDESSPILLRQLRNGEFVEPDEKDRKVLLEENEVDVESWWSEKFREQTIVIR